MNLAALTLGTYLALGLVILVVGFFTLFVIVCLCEKQYLAGDVEPVCEPFPYPPHPYWARSREEARRLGLRHAGDFATRRSTSMVKGLESFFFTPDLLVLASVVVGSTAGAKLKKTVLRGRGELVINATDLFNTMEIRRTIRGTDFRMESTDYLETQVVRVGYGWKF